MAAAANAQASNDKPVGISLRAGLFLPVNGDARDGGDSWVGFGMDYKLKDLSSEGLSYQSAVGLSVDSFQKGSFGNVPVLLNYIRTQGDFFYSVGAGVGFTRTPDENKAKFSYQVGFGYLFPNKDSFPISVEAKFFGCENNQLNGFGIYAGVRL
jgi:hypothetical protein